MGEFTPKSSTDRSHLIWHPVVHYYFRESCYVFLVSAREASAGLNLYSALESILAREAITAYCSYFLFGMHDAMVRFWATDATRQRFLRALTASAIAIDDIREFRSDDVDYLSSGGGPEVTPGNVRDNFGLLEQVAQCERRDAWAKSPEAVAALESLVDLGIVRTVPHADGTKFYTFFQRIGRPVTTPKYEAAGLKDVVGRSDLAAVTLYSGSGYADYLLKAHAPQGFERMRPYLTEIFDHASKLGLKPLTVPLPNANEAYEADALDGIAIPDDVLINNLIDALLEHVPNPNVRSIVVGLPREHQQRLSAVFERGIRLFRGTSFEDRFYSIVDGVIRDDNYTLGDALSFLTHIEGLLRLRLPAILAEELGSDWYTLATELDPSLRSLAPAEKKDQADHKGMTDWSFRHLLLAARVAATAYPGVQAALQSELYLDWEGDLEEIRTLRNEYAHGTLFGQIPLSAFDSDWECQVNRVLAAARFFTHLKDAVERSRT